MRNFLEVLDNWSNEIFFLLIILIFLSFFTCVMRPRIEYANEIEYKNKIIERELGRNFESYEDYLVYRIEIGE